MARHTGFESLTDGHPLGSVSTFASDRCGAADAEPPAEQAAPQPAGAVGTLAWCPPRGARLCRTSSTSSGPDEVDPIRQGTEFHAGLRTASPAPPASRWWPWSRSSPCWSAPAMRSSTRAWPTSVARDQRRRRRPSRGSTWAEAGPPAPAGRSRDSGRGLAGRPGGAGQHRGRRRHRRRPADADGAAAGRGRRRPEAVAARRLEGGPRPGQLRSRQLPGRRPGPLAANLESVHPRSRRLRRHLVRRRGRHAAAVAAPGPGDVPDPGPRPADARGRPAVGRRPDGGRGRRSGLVVAPALGPSRVRRGTTRSSQPRWCSAHATRSRPRSRCAARFPITWPASGRGLPGLVRAALPDLRTGPVTPATPLVIELVAAAAAELRMDYAAVRSRLEGGIAAEAERHLREVDARLAALRETVAEPAA
jgi:hypothetical protein